MFFKYVKEFVVCYMYIQVKNYFYFYKFGCLILIFIYGMKLVFDLSFWNSFKYVKVLYFIE